MKHIEFEQCGLNGSKDKMFRWTASLAAGAAILIACLSPLQGLAAADAVPGISETSAQKHVDNRQSERKRGQ